MRIVVITTLPWLTGAVVLLHEVLPVGQLGVVDEEHVDNLARRDHQVVFHLHRVVRQDLHREQRLDVVGEGELLRERGREGGREGRGGMEGEGRREGEREGEREGGREGGREGEREGGREREGRN